MDHENKFSHFILLIHIFGIIFILYPILMHFFLWIDRAESLG